MADDIRFFSGKKLRIEPGSMGVLLNVYLPDGTEYKDVEPRRYFPISGETTYISIVRCYENDKGKTQEDEYLIIKDMENLDEESEKALAESLRRFYMIPKIIDITSFKKIHDDLQWTVVTDRGVLTFDIRNKYSSIKQLPDGRILIIDSYDNRYEIPDYKTISKKARSMLLGYL